MESHARPRTNLIVMVLVAAIQVYRRLLSPILPPACRFEPSCSAYAIESLRIHGAIRGSWLAMRRLLRCHPGSPAGWDPVPPRSGEAKGRLNGPANDLRVPVDGCAADCLSGDLSRSGQACG